MEKEAVEKSVCPKCGAVGGQNKYGLSKAGSQRYKCKACKREYMLEPATHGYGTAKKEEALKLLTQGMTGRGIGKILGMSKANAYRWSREAAKKGPHECG